MTIMAQFPRHQSIEANTARQRAAAHPVTFSGTVGLFMPARHALSATRLAALFVSPWGFEELCLRKTWRILAEQLSDAGIASLRFDHANTGDALDHETPTLELWRETIIDAAAELQRLSGADGVILIGHGLGAALAADVAGRIGTVQGYAALAPVVSGRSHLRELALWSKMTENRTDLEPGGDPVSGGLTLDKGVSDGIRTINLARTMALPARYNLVAARPDRPGDTDLANQLTALGGDVATIPYEGYDRLVGNLIFSKPPLALIETVVNWVKWVEASLPQLQSFAVSPPETAMPLTGSGFVETPVRFGDHDRLYGILCEPADGIAKGATVLMPTTAYERLSGWGRIATRTARDLARAGIASFRFDAANAGDSPPLPGAPEQIIYSEAQALDVEAAIDFLERERPGPLVIAGRCSGGYLAFHAAARDKRIRAILATNPYVFYWDGSQTLEQLLQFMPQQLGSYGVKAFRLCTWKRIFNGEINAKYAIINISRVIQRRILAAAAPVLKSIPALSREHRATHGAFHALEERGVPFSLIYSEGDIGLDYFKLHFGPNGEKLKRYANVRHQIIPEADHNLSTDAARDLFCREIAAMALAHR